MDELEEAKAKSAEQDKPLIFLYTKPSDKWGPCVATSSEALTVFKSTGVVVFADCTKGEFSKLPKGVKSIQKDGGSTVPILFVTSSDGETGIEAIPYKTLSADMRGARRDLTKKLKEMKSSVSDAEVDVDNPAMLTEELNWTNAEGKNITAAVKSLDGDNVVFLMKNKEVSYPIAKLSEESQTQINALK